MQKRLTKIGSSLGIIIDKAVLDLLRISADTPLDVSTDGDCLTLRPVRTMDEASGWAAYEEIAAQHEKSFKKLLESALAQPMAGFGSEFLHEDLFEMAAAYVFHLAKNHPFVDGNKRTGLAVALTFLHRNDYRVTGEETELADMVLEMVEQRRDKAWVAEQLRQRTRPR